jgi:hypothetical protein
MSGATTLIDPAAATGLTEFTQLKICGFQIGTASCVDSTPVEDGPENTLAACGLDGFNWEAEKSDGIDIEGKCASYSEDGRIKWYEWGFDFCEEHNVLLEQMTGQHDLMTATAGGTDVMGMMAPAQEAAVDCCPPGEGCENCETYMLIWGWNRCGANFHPDYQFLVMYIPRLRWNRDGSGEWQNDDFTQYEWTAQAHFPLGPIGPGVGGIIPAHYANTCRPYYIIGTNSPPPTCGGCGKCSGGTKDETAPVDPDPVVEG